MDIETALKTLHSLPASKDLLTMIAEYTPRWIVAVLDDYAVDYDFLSQNWRTYCDMLKVKPQKIIIVSEMEPYEEDQKEFTPIQQACDVLTMKGYCIRRDTEFIECEGHCGCAMATPELRKRMKTHPVVGYKVRGKWKPKCKNCLKN